MGNKKRGEPEWHLVRPLLCQHRGGNQQQMAANPAHQRMVSRQRPQRRLQLRPALLHALQHRHLLRLPFQCGQFSQHHGRPGLGRDLRYTLPKHPELMGQWQQRHFANRDPPQGGIQTDFPCPVCLPKRDAPRERLHRQHYGRQHQLFPLWCLFWRHGHL